MSFLSFLSPTIDFKVGDIIQIPLIYETSNDVERLSNQNVCLSRADWDAYETSWDFKRHPLIKGVHGSIPRFEINTLIHEMLEGAFQAWEHECDERFQTLKTNEEELNRIFIDIYGLQDELTPEVEDKDVTVRLANKERDVRSFISYAVGCMFGRYSLDIEGLSYAGGD